MSSESILMNPGPRFEEICALRLYKRETGQTPEIIFPDMPGDPGRRTKDIDVRQAYPRGSSAFEQTALKLGCQKKYASLIRVFNADNLSGWLTRRPHRDSFVWLIPRLQDLAPAAWEDKLYYRRFLISETEAIADTIFWAYENPNLKELYGDHPGQNAPRLRHWPQRQNFVKNWPEFANNFPSPFTLTGYAYLIFLEKEHVPSVNLALCQWQERFQKVKSELALAVKRLGQKQPKLFKLGKIWAAHWQVEHGFDSRALFSAYQSVQIIVCCDRRGAVPQAALQVRHGTDLRGMIRRLHRALRDLEPGCWHLEERDGPDQTLALLNGGRNRFCQHSSRIAADPQTIFKLMHECA